MPGPMGTVLKALQMPGVIASLPTVKSLWRDAKVAAGKASIVSMRVVIIKPFKSLLSFFDSS